MAETADKVTISRTGAKPGSFDAMGKIAKALGVAMEDLRVEATPSRRSGDR